MAKEYFVRNEIGEKGPYTRKQMKAALGEGGFSADAEYRAAGDIGWRPIADLAAEFGRAEARKRDEDAKQRAERLDRAPDIEPPQRPGAGSLKEWLGLAGLLAALGAGLWFTRVDREEEMGKPCRVVSDCRGKATCMLSVDDDRNVSAEGYCTFTCGGPGDCKAGMFCGDAMAGASSQGAKWDGTFSRNAKVCLKR